MGADQTHIAWMQHALEQAQLAQVADEVPVGAVVVRDGKILGWGHNCPISSSDATAHAEVQALRAAGQQVGNYRLTGATLYVTLEPCAMCAGAIIQARLQRVVFAVTDPKTGACGSVFNLLQSQALNHQVEIEQGVLADPCRQLLVSFFEAKRRKMSS